MFDYYDMNHTVKEKVRGWVREEGWPEPRASIFPVLTSLITQHKLSLIMGEVDAIVDTVAILDKCMDKAIADNSLVAVVLLKERLEEEKAKLAYYERLLDREGPVEQKQREDTITDDMILRAREYPFEDLLPGELRHGRCACPVHGGNNNQAFTVKNNRGRCFNCGWQGDTIDYVMVTEGYTFPQAVKRLQ
jgi:hypothetical protein